MTPDPLKIIEQAGRICYKSEEQITESSSSKFVEMIIKRGHEAVLEHAIASFKLVTDRGISHELVRHRIASYCQESTRYCNYSKDKFDSQLRFIEPPLLSKDARQIWLDSCMRAEEEYLRMISMGISPQIARSILPNCLKTELIMTANFREWRHIIKLRTSKAAHPQARELISLVQKELESRVPEILGDLHVE